MNLSNEQWKAIKEVLDENTDEQSEMYVSSIRAGLFRLVDKEPYRQAVIALLVHAENLGLEVIPDEESRELVVWSGAVFPDDSGNYSQIQLMSDDEDASETEEDDTDDV